MNITKQQRQFVKEELTIENWTDIQPYFDDLIHRMFHSVDDLKRWMRDKSELEAVIEEDLAWRYIRMTIDTRNKALADSYTHFITKIHPEIAPFEDQLNRKLLDSPFKAELTGQDYFILLRLIESASTIYRAENVPLHAEIREKSQQFGTISGAQSIEHNGERITMQRAGALLRENDTQLRQQIFEKMSIRRGEDRETLHHLFSELIQLRHKVALNAGFENYRDYKFKEMGRFDYTKEDCFAFHQAIKSEIVPMVRKMQQDQAAALGKKLLQPWDTEVDPYGRKPLQPFTTGEELLNKTIEVFDRTDTYFGDCLTTMKAMNHLDLESKDGKSPGGYNYPLYEIGVPFIFMNAVGTHRDMITMLHEGGHAVHSFLSRDQPLTGFKSLPSEVAELASMTMELITMEHWDVFFSNREDLTRAKKEQLETVIKILPWIATIDEFQHWIYEHPQHSVEERETKWMEILDAYSTGMVDWSGYEHVQKISWQRQLHLFEVPFYYIEYGMAQLGALSSWKNFQTNKVKAIQDYKSALRLGYTRSIPDIYKTGGIAFNFSQDHIRSLANFIQQEIQLLDA
jgi:oligoendopeptidase F